MTIFALAKYPTPILNCPDFSYVFGGAPQGIFLDERGLLRSLEMIAFSGELFIIVKKHPLFPHIYEVKLSSYPSDKPLYVDERFLKFYNKKPPERILELPSINTILANMESLIGLPYIWGGNYSLGVDTIFDLYPPQKNKKLSLLEEANWKLKGVDCSGMLYEATQGFTPRNSSWLAMYGEGVAIQNLKLEEIEQLLKPLDMIIWPGHVLFVLDDRYTIESRAHIGHVFVTKISERLKQIVKEENRIPMNGVDAIDYKEKGFIIRRWYFG